MINDAYLADLHLNVATYGGADKDGLCFRSRDFMGAFSWSVDKIVGEILPERVFLLGDIYNNAHPSNKVRRFFNAQVRRLSEAGIEVHILVGNHDACSADYAIEPVVEARFKGVSVYYSPAIVETHDAVYFIYPHSEAVERQEVDLRTHFLATVALWAEKIKTENWKGAKKLILCAHLPIFGAKDSDGHNHEDSDSVRSEDVELLGADFAFLGDFHAHQKLNLKGIEAYYVGSLERSDFRDLESIKGLMTLRRVPTNPTTEALAAFVEYPNARPMRKIEGTLADIEKTLVDNAAVTQGIIKLKFVGDLVQAQEFEKRREEIKKSLITAGARMVLIEEDVRDPKREAQAAQLTNEIQNFDEIGTRDLEEVIESALKAVVPESEERRLIKLLFREVASTVKDKRKASGIASGTLRLHGLKLHNLFRYGTTNNIIELSRGAAEILSNQRKALWEEELLAKRSKELLAQWLEADEKKMISIMGMTDGDENRSNGAGKSSVPEGISYALFSKTVHEFANKEDREKGKSTLSVVSRIRGVYASEAFVELLFSVDDTLWLLRRGREVKPNGSHSPILQLDCLVNPDDASDEGSRSGHRVAGDEELLAELIGMSYETFCNSSMFGQFDAGQFVTGTHKTRQGIIINVLRLGIIDKYLDEIRKRSKVANQEIDALNVKTSMLEDAAKIDLVALNDKISKAEATSMGLDKDILVAEDKVKTLRKAADITLYDAAKSELKLRQDMVDQKRQEKTAAREALSKQFDSNLQRLISNRNRRNNLQAQIKFSTAGVTTLKAEIAAFDRVAHDATVEKVKQAKIAQPKRQKQRAGVQAQRLVLERERSEMQGQMNAVVAESHSVRDLLATADAENIRCPHCHSLVNEDHLNKEIQGFDAKAAEWDAKIKAHTSEIDKLNATDSDLDRRLNAIQEYIQKEPGLVAAIKDLDAKSQSISNSEENIQRWNGELVEVLAGVQTGESEDKRMSDELKTSSKSFDDLIVELDKQVQGAQAKVKTLEQAASGAKERAEAAERAIGVLRDDKENLVAETAKMKATATAVQAAKQQYDEVDRQRIAFQATVSRLDVLDRMCGPDGIQTNIVERYIPLLNSYLQEYLSAVSGNELRAAILTDGKREGKIDIFVEGDCNEEAKNLSGGEGVKLRLALDIALGLLSFARSRNAPDFICLDEVLAPVDRATKDWVFAMLRKLQDRFRMVLVISHDEALQRQLKNAIVVNKIGGISTIARQYYEQPEAEAVVV